MRDRKGVHKDLLTFKNVVFNMFKAVFQFIILLQPCFYAYNRAAHGTVSIQPKTCTNSNQGFRAAFLP